MQFIRAFNLGIQLAFCIHEKIVEASSEAENLIDEAFDAFIKLVEISETQLSQIDALSELYGFRHT